MRNDSILFNSTLNAQTFPLKPYKHTYVPNGSSWEERETADRDSLTGHSLQQ